MRVVFGENRRQKPLEIVTPGGTITLSREIHGTVLVRLGAVAGVLQVTAPTPEDYAVEVRIVRTEADDDGR